MNENYRTFFGLSKEPFGAAPGEELLSQAFADARRAAAAEAPSLDVLEALLYAASERSDREARALLAMPFDRLLSGPLWDRERLMFLPEGESSLLANCRRARMFWAAHALTREARWREAAEGRISDARKAALFEGRRVLVEAELMKVAG